MSSTALSPQRLDTACLEQIVAAAGAAPSLHNTQPWRYRLQPDAQVLEVHAVPARALRAIDPTGRALHLSVGAAVFNLRTAARHLGWEAMVRLLPCASDPQLLARIRFADTRRSGSRAGPDLYDAIWRRHSSRQPFSDRPVPAAVVSELVEAVQVEGARLVPADRAETRRLLAVTAEAERRTVADPLRSAESRRWIGRHQGDPYGIPVAALGPRDSTGRIPTRDFTGLAGSTDLADFPGLGTVERSAGVPFEDHPMILVLATAYDRRVDWLRAGQAMQHMLLLATTHRIRGSLLHQAMEWPDLRRSLGSGPGRLGHVQMVARLGYGPEGAAGPRQSPARTLEAPGAAHA